MRIIGADYGTVYGANFKATYVQSSDSYLPRVVTDKQRRVYPSPMAESTSSCVSF